MMDSLLIIILLALVFAVSGQDYAEYARGAGMARNKNNRGPIVTALVAALCGGALGSYWKGNSDRKTCENEKRELQAFLENELLEQIHRQDEYRIERDHLWAEEFQKLKRAYDRVETSNEEYQEFKGFDMDNDDRITKGEYNAHVRKLIATNPALSIQDFPKFEQLDLDNNELIRFDEWQKFIEQRQREEAKIAKVRNERKKEKEERLVHCAISMTPATIPTTKQKRRYHQ